MQNQKLTGTNGVHVSDKFCVALFCALETMQAGTSCRVRREAPTVTERQRIHGCDIGNMSASATFAPFLWLPLALRTNGTNT